MTILLYTWQSCRHCVRARELLSERSLDFHEVALERDRALAGELARRLGKAAMPYALVDGELLGGVEELGQALDQRVAQAAGGAGPAGLEPLGSTPSEAAPP